MNLVETENKSYWRVANYSGNQSSVCVVNRTALSDPESL